MRLRNSKRTLVLVGVAKYSLAKLGLSQCVSLVAGNIYGISVGLAALRD